MNKKKIIKQLEKIITELEEKSKLDFEEHNFKINSEDWKKIIIDNRNCLVNPEEDIWEILDKECRGEQLFTWEAAMRETKKRGKRLPTDKDLDELLKTKEDIPNLVFPGYRFYYGGFNGRGSHANFWSSSESGGNAWRRYLNSGFSTVYRYTSNEAYGFSVRCLKD